MGKKILITSTDLMMIQFLVPHVQNFSEHGYEVEITCSDVGGYVEDIRNELKGSVKKVYIVHLVRSPFSFTNFRGYKELTEIIDNGNYDIIWTNEPVMGAATRLAARKAHKKGTKIVYMVHGFHFYKGAPLINWLFFYPAERMLALLTDYIITVNQEDYARAGRLPVKRAYYIHGIGANTDRLQRETVDQNIRKRLQIPETAFLILSVGELNANKNQKVIIDVLSLLQDKDIYYVLCGSGKNLKSLQLRTKKKHLENHVKFVEYRRDVINFYNQADIFALPSYREGLPVALLEAMYCGVAPVTSNIRGVRDVMKNRITGIVCRSGDVKMFARAIKTLKENKNLRKMYGKNSRKAVEPYMLSLVKDRVLDIFESFARDN